MILDHTQDISGTETHRLTSLFDAPEFVKQADHNRLHGDPEMLPAHVYGDQATRTWPLHSAPAVWMSSLFFFDKQAELDATRANAVESRLLQAAQHFNILPQVQELKTKIANSFQYELARVPDSDFGVVWETDNGKERHYPLRNAQEVKMAADWFSKYRDEFVWTDRRIIAGKIHEKAAEHKVVLDDPDMIEKTAGLGYCSAADVVDMLVKRADMTARSHNDLSAELRNLATIVANSGLDMRDIAMRDKIAQTVDQFDRETKLNQLYDDGGLERPEEVMFLITAKTADAFLDAHV